MKYYICPDCGRALSRKKIEIEHRKRCICGAGIDRKRAGLPEREEELHFVCAYCGTDNAIKSERTPPEYTVTCKCCKRIIVHAYKYAPLVYGGRGFA